MSVVTRNPFALLNDDDEASAPVVAPTPAPETTEPATRPNNKSRGAAANSGSRSGRYPRRGGAPVTQESESFSAGNPNEPGQPFDRTQGRPERGRGRGRGGRGRGGDRPERGRVYDKHSQTGVVDTDKKVDQGWGAETGTAELAAEAEGEADAKADIGTETPAVAAVASGWDEPAPDAAAGWGNGAPAVDGDVAAAAKPSGEGRKPRREEEEEEDNTLTLEEYLAQKKTSDAVPKLEGGRKINDNNGEWKDAVQLLKDESEDVYFAGKTKAAPKPRAKKEEKVVIEIDARFERPQRDGARGRGGRGRGGDRGGDRARGGGRGRGGRGGPRGESNGYNGRNNAAAAVDVDDQSAFPSLA